jgi:threonylcarbamoyladenosine tRNA methylthiotransferase MtaB
VRLPRPDVTAMRVFVETHGCRVNRYDGAALAAALVGRGHEVVDDAADPHDVYVLNSCAVTSAAEAEGRRYLWRARRRLGASGVVVAIGCAAEITGAAYSVQAGGPADLVVRAAAKGDVAALLDAHLARRASSTSSPTAPTTAAATANSKNGTSTTNTATDVQSLPVDDRSSRFFYKVQEGCDVRCAFCIIPDARGPARSVPPDEALALLRRARAAGFQEFILAGIHLGGYGRDLPAPARTTLAALCRRVLDGTSVPRLRLGSIEPWGLRPDFLALYAGEPRLLPSLHVPLQSGSDAVLRAMRRPITAAGYLAAAERALAARPDTTLFIDVLVGFPGETDADFASTVALLARLPFTKLHVFPYSERPGTPAARSTAPRVPDPVKRARVRQLLDWSDERFRARLAARAGEPDEVVAESADRGHTRDNLPVHLVVPPGVAPPPRRALVSVTLGAARPRADPPHLVAFPAFHHHGR